MAKWLRVVSGSVFLAASFYFFLGSQGSMTGAFIGAMPQGSASVFAVVAALTSGIIFASSFQTQVRVKSAIGKDKTLVRLAEEAANSKRVQEGLDHMADELSKGHVPGRVRHLSGTDVLYIGNYEARLYYRPVSSGYEIVAKSRKGKNQEQVIEKLEKAYKK